MGTLSSLERSPLVLIVDDDEDARELYAEFLEGEGFAVSKTPDGLGGFARACESQPDVIVTDLKLPGIDGWELVRRVKADGRPKDIPIVVVTGWVTPAYRDRAGQMGCAAFLMKPCLPDALAREIRRFVRVLAGRRSARRRDTKADPD